MAMRPTRRWGASADAKLVPLQPLLDRFTDEMGDLPGRLMLALSFLRDARQMNDVPLKPEVQFALEQTEALLISALARLTVDAEGEEQGCSCGCCPEGDFACSWGCCDDSREDGEG